MFSKFINILLFIASLGVTQATALAEADSDQADHGADGAKEGKESKDNKSGNHHRAVNGKGYKYEVSGSISYTSEKTTVGSDSSTSDNTLDINGRWLFVLGKFEVGPGLAYSNTTGGGTATQMAVGAAGKWNFGVLGGESAVPYGLLQVSVTSSQQTVGNTKITQNGTGLQIGGGVDVFIVHNVAFQPEVVWFNQSSKDNSDPSIKTTSTGLTVQFGLGIFL